MIILILILAFTLRLFGANQSFWLDEAAQLVESVRPLKDQLAIQADFQPPLFHVLMHFWLYLGKNEIIIRLLPIILGIVTIYVSYLLFTEIFNKKIALITSFLVALSPFHVWYSQEVRPYSLSALLGIVTTYFLIKNKFIWYVLMAICFFYTTYFAPFLLAAQGIYLFLFQRKYFKKWCICLLFIILAFLPWLPSFFEQLIAGKNLTGILPGWSEAVSIPVIKALPLVFIKFIIGRISFDNKILYGSISVLLFILYILLIYKSYSSKKYDLKPVLLFLSAPIIISFIVSIFLPVIAPQRLLFCLPFFYALIAAGISCFGKNRAILLAFFTGISLYSLFLYNTNPKYQRENWRGAINFVELSSRGNSKVIFVFPDAFAPWYWYSHNKLEFIAIAPDFVVTPETVNKYSAQVDTADKIYLFHYLTGITDPDNLVPDFLKKRGFSENTVKDFPGVGFISIYEKNMARI